MHEGLKDLDVEQITEEIRSEVRRRLAIRPPFPDRTPAGPGLGSELALLHETADVYNVELTTKRRLFGPLMVAARKVARRFLLPSLARQISYNVANLRAVEGLREQCNTIARYQAKGFEEIVARQTLALDALRQRLDVLAITEVHLQTQARTLEGLSKEIESLRQGQAEWNAYLRALQAQVARREDIGALDERLCRAERALRKLARGVTESGRESTRGNLTGAGSTPVTTQEDETDLDTLGFQEKFRGPEAEIKRRQRAYVECFHGRDGVVDIACGRGEFLELMSEAGIAARGVDSDPDMIQICCDKGLEATREDAFAHLSVLPDGALGGIFAAQFVEHLEARDIVRLVRVCHRKLQHGAPLVLETVNPRCLFALAETFYMDLTHVKPVHPEALRFLLVTEGFEQVEVRYSAPVDAGMRIPEAPGLGPAFNQAIERVNDLLYGFQDYAVIAKKVAQG